MFQGKIHSLVTGHQFLIPLMFHHDVLLHRGSVLGKTFDGPSSQKSPQLNGTSWYSMSRGFWGKRLWLSEGTLTASAVTAMWWL